MNDAEGASAYLLLERVEVRGSAVVASAVIVWCVLRALLAGDFWTALCSDVGCSPELARPQPRRINAIFFSFFCP